MRLQSSDFSCPFSEVAASHCIAEQRHHEDSRGKSLTLVLPSTARQARAAKAEASFPSPSSERESADNATPRPQLPLPVRTSDRGRTSIPEGVSFIAIIRMTHGQAGCERHTLASMLQSIPVLIHASSFLQERARSTYWARSWAFGRGSARGIREEQMARHISRSKCPQRTNAGAIPHLPPPELVHWIWLVLQ